MPEECVYLGCADVDAIAPGVCCESCHEDEAYGYELLEELWQIGDERWVQLHYCCRRHDQVDRLTEADVLKMVEAKEKP